MSKKSKKPNKHHEYDGEATEFLFESDREKAILNDAVRQEKNKPYKHILLNSLIISCVLIAMSLSINCYQRIVFGDLMASASSFSDKSQDYEEKMNQSSSNLKKIDNNYFNKYEIIINKSNPIEKSMVKNYKMVDVKDNSYDNIKLEEETYLSYLRLKNNLRQKGYYINIKSGFKTFSESKDIYDTYVLEKGKNYADRFVAKPGVSEHNSGLAFDFVLSDNKNDVETDYESDEYNYLKDIAHLYGFIIRYPKGKESVTGYSYEPWHLRYVGKSLARYLKFNNLTLEEYYTRK